VIIMANIAIKMMMAKCPSDSFCATPNSGTGAIGWTRTMPKKIRSQSVSTRFSLGAVEVLFWTPAEVSAILGASPAQSAKYNMAGKSLACTNEYTEIALLA